MRAEIAAESEGRRRTRALTWYAGGIAAIEAAGAAVAALLPVGSEGTVTGPLLVVVIAVYVIVLLPTFLVARSSRIGTSTRTRGHFPLLRCVPMFAGAFAVMLLASGPAFLSVALTAELHGRMWVAPAAVAFTAGALIAPLVLAALERRRFPALALWPLLGVGMIGGWSVAAWSVGGLLFAQFLSGVFMTSFEGTIDARVAETVPEQVTAGMAWAGAARALGSAAALLGAGGDRRRRARSGERPLWCRPRVGRLRRAARSPRRRAAGRGGLAAYAGLSSQVRLAILTVAAHVRPAARQLACVVVAVLACIALAAPGAARAPSAAATTVSGTLTLRPASVQQVCKGTRGGTVAKPLVRLSCGATGVFTRLPARAGANYYWKWTLPISNTGSTKALGPEVGRSGSTSAPAISSISPRRARRRPAVGRPPGRRGSGS